MGDRLPATRLFFGINGVPSRKAGFEGGCSGRASSAFLFESEAVQPGSYTRALRELHLHRLCESNERLARDACNAPLLEAPPDRKNLASRWAAYDSMPGGSRDAFINRWTASVTSASSLLISAKRWRNSPKIVRIACAASRHASSVSE